MSRSIPIDLVDHLAKPATSTCRLLKITPLVTELDDGHSATVPGVPFGLTTLNRDVTFDDGDGELLYNATTGYTPFTIQASADLSVDNSEVEALVSTFEVDGFVIDAVERGVYDDATYIEYLVNYEDLSQGKAILGSGTIGQIRIIDGLMCSPEFRSLSQTLKQKSLIEDGSVGCRVVEFGDERCKYDVDSEWVSATVDSVGAETDRTFTITGMDVELVADYYAPGVVVFNDGANEGRTYEIESYTSGGVVTLAVPTEKPIEAGDTLDIRRDCTRQWEGHNSCQTYNNRLNYRGEPFRPVADSASLMVPGASSSGGIDTQAT